MDCKDSRPMNVGRSRRYRCPKCKNNEKTLEIDFKIARLCLKISEKTSKSSDLADEANELYARIQKIKRGAA